MARPIRAEAPSRSCLAIRLSPNEHAVIRTAARVNKQTVAGFIREAVSTAAGECLEPIPTARPNRIP
jgi:uncharacterized protein (DUF1778 family)